MNKLTEYAYEDLCLTLQSFNNQLNEAHGAALHDILSVYTRLAEGSEDVNPKTRYAFPLATAMGKTQSIVSWAYGVYRLDLPYTILVCQEQIRDLDELRKDLIAKGVPEERVGLFHRDPEQAPVSSGSPEDYQFVLITHSMIRTTKEADLYMETGDGNHRSLCVYDESLIKSEGRTVTGSSLEAASAVVQTVLHSDFTNRERLTEEQFELLDYLTGSLAAVIGKFRSGDDEPFEVNDKLSAEKYSQFLTAIDGLPRPVDRPARGVITSFLAMTAEPIRVAKMGMGNKDGIINYQLRIPPGLSNVVILDASAAVRELQEADEDIKVIDKWENVKRFTKLEVDQYKVQSGAGFQRDKMTMGSALMKDISRDITSGWLPSNSAVVFCMSKGADNLPRNRKTPTEKLQARLRRDGVDLDATVTVWQGYDSRTRRAAGEVIKPKYEFITYGQERSTNRYRHCSHIIAVGVARRDLVELAGNLAGQLEDISNEEVVSYTRIASVQASEQFYRLQQLIGRGTTRETRNGESGAAHIKVYDHGDFSAYIQRGLPGCTWNVHTEGTYAKNVHHKRKVILKSDARQAAEVAGISYLRDHPEKVMVSRLTALPELRVLGRDTRKRVLKDIGEATCRERGGNGRGAHYTPLFD